MTVRLAEDGTIALEGDCPVEEAEMLQKLFLRYPAARIDWRRCNYAHTAVLQVLLAVKPEISGPPRSAFLQDWIHPILSRSGT